MMIVLQLLEIVLLAVVALLLIRLGIAFHWSFKVNDRNLETKQQLSAKWEQAKQDFWSTW